MADLPLGLVSLLDWERANWGLGNTEIGARVLELWEFPEESVAAIRFHLSPNAEPPRAAADGRSCCRPQLLFGDLRRCLPDSGSALTLPRTSGASVATMSDGPISSRFNAGVLCAAAVLFGCFVYLLLPGWTIALNDDFAYLRSVVETLQRGRPWTDDFLEPWSMSLSVISAGVFELTGSFSAATIGLQAVLAAVSFYVAARIIAPALGSPWVAISISAALLTFPSVLWKQAEFTAMIVYLPSLLAALWAAARGRWGWFWVAWAVAVTSRQSAVAWLALPAVAAVQTGIARKSSRSWLMPALVVIGGVGWFLFLFRYANLTHAQRYITAHFITSIGWRATRTSILVAAWVCAVAFGWVSLLIRSFVPADAGSAQRGGVRMVGVLLAIALLATIPLVGRNVPLSYEHPLFENPWAVGYLRALVAVAAAGWAAFPPRIRLAHAVTVVVAMALACLRSELWDYYLADGIIIGGFGIIAGFEVPTARPQARAGWRLAATALIGAIIVVQVIATGPLKRLLDNRAGACAVLEKAMRAGWMNPTELSDAPFGFVAWHLFPYFVTHEGARSGDLGGFGIYVAGHSVDVQIETVDRSQYRMRRGSTDPNRPFSEVRPRGWFGYARFSLARRLDHDAPATQLKTSDYTYRMFPLNDAEWRQLLTSVPAER